MLNTIGIDSTVSNENGANQVYLTTFPQGDGRWQVSFVVACSRVSTPPASALSSHALAPARFATR